MKVLNYTVTVHPAKEGGFWAEVPTLSGCFTQGESLEEITMNAREAIECHLAGLAKLKKRIPVERHTVKNMRPFSVPILVKRPVGV
jgi:predicted RNase H-like HicB family nuclease